MRIEFLALRLANNQNLREESWDAGCCSPTWPTLLPDLHTTHLVPSPVFVYSVIPYPSITSWSRLQVLWTWQLEMKFMFFIWKKTKQTKKNKMKQRNIIINKAKKPPSILKKTVREKSMKLLNQEANSWSLVLVVILSSCVWVLLLWPRPVSVLPNV